MSEIIEAPAMVNENIVLPVVKNNRVVDSKTSERAKDLLDKVSWLIKCLGKNAVIPILENLLFCNGAITAYNLQVAAMQLTSIKGYFLIPARKLQSILQSLDKKDVVSFALTGECMIEIIVNDEPIFKFSSEEPTSYPKINKCEVVIGEFPDALDIEQLTIAKNYTSSDPLRVAQQHVMMDDKNIVATNGHWMVFKKIKSTLIHDEGFKLMFPKRAIELLSSFKHATIKRTVDATYIMVKETNRAVIFKNCDEQYPDYMNVIPTQANIKFSICKKKLSRAINLALIVGNKVSNQGILKIVHGSDQAILSSIEDVDFGDEFKKSVPIHSIDWTPELCKETIPDPTGAKIEGTDIIKSITVDSFKPLATGDEFLIGINLKFLSEIVKDSLKEDLRFEMSKPNKAMIINNDVLLMPCMINREP